MADNGDRSQGNGSQPVQPRHTIKPWAYPLSGRTSAYGTLSDSSDDEDGGVLLPPINSDTESTAGADTAQGSSHGPVVEPSGEAVDANITRTGPATQPMNEGDAPNLAPAEYVAPPGYIVRSSSPSHSVAYISPYATAPPASGGEASSSDSQSGVRVKSDDKNVKSDDENVESGDGKNGKSGDNKNGKSGQKKKKKMRGKKKSKSSKKTVESEDRKINTYISPYDGEGAPQTDNGSAYISPYNGFYHDGGSTTIPNEGPTDTVNSYHAEAGNEPLDLDLMRNFFESSTFAQDFAAHFAATAPATTANATAAPRSESAQAEDRIECDGAGRILDRRAVGLSQQQVDWTNTSAVDWILNEGQNLQWEDNRNVEHDGDALSNHTYTTGSSEETYPGGDFYGASTDGMIDPAFSRQTATATDAAVGAAVFDPERHHHELTTEPATDAFGYYNGQGITWNGGTYRGQTGEAHQLAATPEVDPMMHGYYHGFDIAPRYGSASDTPFGNGQVVGWVPHEGQTYGGSASHVSSGKIGEDRLTRNEQPASGTLSRTATRELRPLPSTISFNEMLRSYDSGATGPTEYKSPYSNAADPFGDDTQLSGNTTSPKEGPKASTKTRGGRKRHLPDNGFDRATKRYKAESGVTGHYIEQKEETTLPAAEPASEPSENESGNAVEGDRSEYAKLRWHQLWQLVPNDVSARHVKRWQDLLDTIPCDVLAPANFDPKATFTSAHPRTNGTVMMPRATMPDWIPQGAPQIVLMAYKLSFGRITWMDIAMRCGHRADDEDATEVKKAWTKHGNGVQMRVKRYRDTYGFTADGRRMKGKTPAKEKYSSMLEKHNLTIKWSSRPIQHGEPYCAKRVATTEEAEEESDEGAEEEDEAMEE